MPDLVVSHSASLVWDEETIFLLEVGNDPLETRSEIPDRASSAGASLPRPRGALPQVRSSTGGIDSSCSATGPGVRNAGMNWGGTGLAVFFGKRNSNARSVPHRSSSPRSV